MDESERAALSALRFNWAPTYEDVWAPPEAHVDGINTQVAKAMLDGYADANASRGPSPLGIAITGEKGAGKTHLLSWVRTQVQQNGGYFFLVGLLHDAFWPNISHALLHGLRRPGYDGRLQLVGALDRLGERLGVSNLIRAQMTGKLPITRPALDDLAQALRRADPGLGQECRHTLRALVMVASDSAAACDVGEAYLMSIGEAVPGERAEWGIHPEMRPARQIAGEISRLLALTGSSLLAVDQIDTLISQSGPSVSTRAETPIGPPRNELVMDVGTGLMNLRETLHRTVTVVACQHRVWVGIERNTVGSVGDRFRQESRLNRIPSAEVGRALVTARFGPRFAEIGFVPKYPTWPVLPQAFETAPRFSPRGLFLLIDAHVRGCLEQGAIVPLASLDERVVESSKPDPTDEQPVSEEKARSLDERFTELVRLADPAAAVDRATEDQVMPVYLDALLRSWIEEQGLRKVAYALDPPPGAKPALHARIRQTLDEQTEDELHWAFRSIAGRHHGTVRARLEHAKVIAGLEPGRPKRKLYVLKPASWSSGPVTREKIQAFESAGGVVLPVHVEDLKVCNALKRMWVDGGQEFRAWLRLRRPASRTALLRAVFGEPGAVDVPDSPPDLPPAPTERPAADPAPAGREPEAPPSGPDTLPLGVRADTGTPISTTLESLRKHTVIFAGSGSGKTVLIRRMVEECALLGVSAIVLDPNNDLARLGDAWPEPPAGWSDTDPARAAGYLAGTEVVIWTPRREAGRPLSFQPLPDFEAVREDPDEFNLALDTAVAALAPRARTEGTTAKAERGRAVLREALAYAARHGVSGLNAFLDLLTELPDDVTTLTKAAAMAEDLAQTLRASMINDPLFGGGGVPLDPGVLLLPSPGKRARISVLSMIGLQTNQQRQSFVNQLQMALFAWIKQHPAGDRPLGGLFVMDEAQTLAPSGAMTACTESTLALASQARKYGLGLIFATQAPRGIHNRIVGNAATQFYGFLNSPAQISAAREMAQAKASGVVDISRLTAGQFYAVGEGLPFQKVLTPMCLSHHPPSALTAEEVLTRARDGG